MVKMTKRRKAVAKAGKASRGGLREMAITKWSAEKHQRYRDRKMGKMGAASPVVRIDPATGRPREED